MIAAMKHGRNSIGVELDREYCRQAARRLSQENSNLFSEADLQFLRLLDNTKCLSQETSTYGVKRGPRTSSEKLRSIKGEP